MVFGQYLLGFVLIALMSAQIYLHIRVGRPILNAYLQRQSVELLKATYTLFPFRGSYRWRGIAAAVYRIEARLPDTRIKRGWLCFQLPLWIFIADGAGISPEVIWDAK